MEKIISNNLMLVKLFLEIRVSITFLMIRGMTAEVTEDKTIEIKVKINIPLYLKKNGKNRFMASFLINLPQAVASYKDDRSNLLLREVQRTFLLQRALHL